MKKEILELLFHAGDFMSGEQISDALGVSRAAVWKHIKAIKEEGGSIEAQTNKGYRLTALPDVLKKEYIDLWTKEDHERIHYLQEIDSTNEYAKKMARDGAPDESVYIAELQTKGKGRLNRGWTAGIGEAIQMSVLLRPGFEPAKAPAITFAAALGVISAIRQVCGLEAKIKWPNDVVFGGKKLCGILTEMSSDMDQVEYIVCGMGLNVNQERFPPEIADKAVSLRMITGRRIDRVRLCAAMIDSVTSYFRKYILHGIDSSFDEYCSNSVIIGKEIRIVGGAETMTGLCEGFSKQGALIVRTAEGIREFLAGEVSVRGMEQYIES